MLSRVVCLALALLSGAEGFAGAGRSRSFDARRMASRRSAGGAAIRMENFVSLGNPLAEYAEDQNVNSDKLILGEANFKEFVGTYKPDALTLDGQLYNPLVRAADLKASSIVADSGLLRQLDDMGFTLADVENLLPMIDQLNVLSLAANNLPLVGNALALVIEPSAVALPVVATTLKVPQPLFYLAAVAALGLDGKVLIDQGPVFGALAAVPLLPFAAVSVVLAQVVGLLSGGGSGMPAAPRAQAASAPSLPSLPSLPSFGGGGDASSASSGPVKIRIG